MKISKFLALAVFVVLAITFPPAQAQEHPTKKEHPAKVDGICAVAAGADNFKTLVTAIEAAGF